MPSLASLNPNTLSNSIAIKEIPHQTEVHLRICCYFCFDIHRGFFKGTKKRNYKKKKKTNGIS